MAKKPEKRSDLYEQWIVDEYTELLEARENLELLQMADDRMKNFNQQETLSHDDILKEYNISEERLDKIMESVEIE
jgi:galactokinase